MKDETPQTVHLADYQPPSHLIESVALTFRLAPRATRVLSRIRFVPNPARPGRQPLRLDGEDLKLIAAAIDGRPVAAKPDSHGLTLPAEALPDAPFTWEAEVEISPETNTLLEGLYMSNGMY